MAFDRRYAPCGFLIVRDGQHDKDELPHTVLIQSDWDFPGVAQRCGWSLDRIQKCALCGHVGLAATSACHGCGSTYEACDHEATDGTVTCGCGVTVSDFISAAYDWLRGHANKSFAELNEYLSQT